MVELKRELQANSKLATLKDDDDRLPLHWAVAEGHLDVVTLLAQRKDFDPDSQVISFGLDFSEDQAYQLDLHSPVTNPSLGWCWLDPFDDSSQPQRGRRYRQTPVEQRSRC